MTIAIQELLVRRRAMLLALLALFLAASAWIVYRYLHQPPPYQGSPRIQINLQHPEMLLSTRSLADLPTDIAGTPALQGLVDEQLVFHYEEDEARLSLEGSLRRLAYEHNLDLQDRFFSTLLAAPAEIAFWRASKGRPEYFIATIERGALAKLAEALAKIALNDRQLKQGGVFHLAGNSLPLYTLDYGGGRTLAFIGAGERWIFLSDPGLVLDEKGNLTKDAATTLGELLQGHHPWQAVLPHAASAKHSLVIGPEALTLGYYRFMPALRGLRFDFDGAAWHPALHVDNTALPENYDLNAGLTALWRTLPANAALCAVLPVDWKAAGAPLGKLLETTAGLEATLNALGPLGAICWYADSRLSAPLFIATAERPLPPESALLIAALAGKSWSLATNSSEQPKGLVKDERYVTAVPSRHGLRLAGTKERSFHPALARREKLILFSPDRRQVDAALAVAAKHAPAAGDVPGLQGPAWLILDPKRLAQLVRSEVQEVLPADEESFFREVARNRLWPRLDAWGQQQQASAFAPGARQNDGFVVLEAKAYGTRGKAGQ